VITAGDQGPHELMQADSLGRPACADCAKSTLDIFSLHAESLCQLSRDAAVELGNNGSLAAFSTTTVIVRNWRADFSDACTERKLMKAAARSRRPIARAVSALRFRYTRTISIRCALPSPQ